MNETWSLRRHSDRFQGEQLLRCRDVFMGTVVWLDIEC